MRRRKKKKRIPKGWILGIVLIVLSVAFIIEAMVIKGKSVSYKDLAYSSKNFQKRYMIVTSARDSIKTLENRRSNVGTPIEEIYKNDEKKIAYLTFDDGPSTTVTPKILNTLEQNNINATFFLIGSNVQLNDESKDLVRRTFYDGNSIGNHTYNHKPEELFPNNSTNVPLFISQIDATNLVLKTVLGQDFNTRLVRIPGGRMTRVHTHDVNLNQLEQAFSDKGIVDIDWNCYDFDAEGKPKNAQQLLENVKRTSYGKKKIVILMHDTYGKEETAKALPNIIEYLRSQGYEFGTLK
ncbi:polysaccharide deacetylase family protein [Clostridium felsineum]|uniref:polysaccharide deacetylase family protein n=1 Tax=Clostridium felsineum TaxID=36839 RepID=UPI00098C125D|nr:polysaccharide deacetylase family protein [Clostridium felsineum]URZ02698.1 hypothetical protein CLAUR_027220 [Clostridium felsineum]